MKYSVVFDFRLAKTNERISALMPIQASSEQLISHLSEVAFVRLEREYACEFKRLKDEGVGDATIRQAALLSALNKACYLSPHMLEWVKDVYRIELINRNNLYAGEVVIGDREVGLMLKQNRYHREIVVENGRMGCIRHNIYPLRSKPLWKQAMMGKFEKR